MENTFLLPIPLPPVIAIVKQQFMVIKESNHDILSIPIKAIAPDAQKKRYKYI